MKRSMIAVLALSSVVALAACEPQGQVEETPAAEEEPQPMPMDTAMDMGADTMMADTMMADTMMPDTGMGM